MDTPTLLDKIRMPYEFYCRKHGAAPDATAYADEVINRMSNVELLQEISQALEEMLSRN